MVIPSIVLKCLFLIPLLLIGVITSYSDIKYGKIKNIHLLLGFIYVLFLYSFLFFYSYFIIHQPSNSKYIVELIINGSITFILGYLLWHFNSWAAGDAKLFFIYSLLIPLEFYSKNYVPYFPSSILLIDTFLLICLIFFFKMFFKIAVSCLSYVKKPFSPILFFSKINYKNLKNTALETGKIFLIMSCFLLIMQYAMMKINIIFPKLSSNSSLIYLLFIVLQVVLFKKIFKNKKIIILIIFGGLLCGLSLIISNQTTLLISIIKSSIFLMLFFSIGIQLVHLYIERQEIKKTKIQELHSGCFLSLKSLAEITKKVKKQALADNLSLNSSDGLSEFQVQTIQKLFKDDLKKELYVYRTFPFAPFMFLAFIFIIFAKGSFLFFLLHLWGLFK
jgi:hypothetical protein